MDPVRQARTARTGPEPPAGQALPNQRCAHIGTAGKYHGRYSDEALIEWTDWLVEQTGHGRSAWAYFNNDIHGHSIEDARTLKSMIGLIAR